jgi:hypothetical protein
MANLNKADLQTDINGKVYENTSNAITGANLNTVLTDVNDSKASLKDNNTFEGTISAANLSNTNTGDETTTTLGSKINAATAKTTPIDNDLFGLVDSAASNVLKKLSFANLKATLKTYFDGIYSSSRTVKHYFNSGAKIDYMGVAPQGSSTTAFVWTITAITIGSGGSVTTSTLTNQQWTY